MNLLQRWAKRPMTDDRADVIVRQNWQSEAAAATLGAAGLRLEA
jgi:hypothetical protein